MPGLSEYLQKDLNMSVDVGEISLDDWKFNFECDEEVEEMFRSSLTTSFALTLGLALRGLDVSHFVSTINLLPKAIKDKEGCCG